MFIRSILSGCLSQVPSVSVPFHFCSHCVHFCISLMYLYQFLFKHPFHPHQLISPVINSEICLQSEFVRLPDSDNSAETRNLNLMFTQSQLCFPLIYSCFYLVCHCICCFNVLVLYKCLNRGYEMVPFNKHWAEISAAAFIVLHKSPILSMVQKILINE